MPTPGSATTPTTPPSPCFGPLEGLLEDVHLPVAADEAGEAALAREVEPRARLADPGELEDPDRPAGALDLELAEVLELEEAAASSAVLSVRYALPGSASASIRCARPTVWPIAV